jgi:hypothetical protein
MADRKEKVILEVNLDVEQLIQKQIDSRQKIDALKAANKELAAQAKKDLEQGLTASYQAVQKKIIENEAALRDLNREQKSAQRLIDFNTRANQAASGSYEELYSQWQVAETQLKLLEGTLARNAEGQFELTDEYTRASAKVREYKDALLQFNAGVLDGRLNVGNYAESIKGLEQRLAEFASAQQNATIGSEQYAQLEQQMIATQAQLDAARLASLGVQQQNANTIAGMQQQIIMMQQLYAQTAVGSDNFNLLGRSIDTAKQKLAEATGVANQFSEGSIQGMKLKLTELQKEFESVDVGTDKWKELNQQIDALKKKLADATTPANQFTEGSLLGMKKRLSELQKEFDSIDVNSDKWKELKEVIDKLKLSIAQADGRLDEFGGAEDRNPIIGEFNTLNDVIGGTSAALDIAGAFMDENSKAMNKLQDIVKYANALMQIRNVQIGLANALDAVSIVRTKLKTGATIAYTAAQKVLNAVMNKFPLFIIITAITALIGTLIALKDKIAPVKAAFDALAAVFSAIGDALAWVGEAIGIWGESAEEKADKVVAAQEREMKAINRRYNREILEAQAVGKATSELEKLKILATQESVQKQIDALEKLKKEEGKLNDEKKQQLIDLNDQLLDLSEEYYAISMQEKKEGIEAQKKLDADIQSQRVANMKDGSEKELAQLRLNTDRRLAEIKGTSFEENSLRSLIEEGYQKEAAAIRLKYNKKYADDEKKLREQLEDALTRQIRDARDRELRQNELDYSRRIEQVKGNGKTQVALRAALLTEQRQKEVEINKRFDQEAINRVVEAERSKWDLLIEKAQVGSQESLDAKLNLAEVEFAAEMKLAGSNEDKRIAAMIRYRNRRAAIEEQWRREAIALAAQRRADELQADIIQAELNERSTITLLRDQAALERELALKEQGLTNERKLLIEAEYQAKLKAINEKAAADEAALWEKRRAVVGNFFSGVYSMMELFGTNQESLNDFAKLSALFQIGIDSAKAISAVIEYATRDPKNLLTGGLDVPIKISAGVATVLANAAQAKRIIQGTEQPGPPTITGFDAGGNLAFEGGNIPAGGGMIKGRPHGRGGVRFWMGRGRIGEADGRKGEAYIVNTGNDPYLKSIASWLNVAGGGKPFASFDQGGITPQLYAQGGPVFAPGYENAALVAAIASMRPVVSVHDIVKGINRVETTTARRKS